MRFMKLPPKLTIEYIRTAPENKHFDCKSASIRVADLAQHISAFANAEGGTIVLGVSDRTRLIEGINAVGEEKLNDFINAPKDFCRPMPQHEITFLEVVNEFGKADRLLLLHIEASVDRVIFTERDQAWVRFGDKSKEMRGENLRNLEYLKGTRHYEDELNYDITIDDLDANLVNEYKKRIGAENLSTETVLRARGFMRRHQGQSYLTNAAVLLFAENIQQFYPNSRVRFVRYDGTFAQVGTRINILKDYSIEMPLLKILTKAKEFISAQLREFTTLNTLSGTFQIVPEYPEFAWLEGIVNAVTHREYALNGAYIKVSMYDDRLEIESPGRLPSIVTVENIRETRFSRNPRISRVLTEFGWVRELNEGVKRIYSDMKDFFLEAPVFTEQEQGVRLILKNNIVVRQLRQKDRMSDKLTPDKWDSFDNLERQILILLINRGPMKRIELEKETGKSTNTIVRRLKHLTEEGVMEVIGNPKDPTRLYKIIIPNDSK